ncbi:YkgJ family cysteine cluster protein [Haliangium sp.]|uniref:YkgJ family cysteine cluster protein n=1 Tax=Haliangium sp. TaxID=2663208 RepID=UPI003D0C58E9
MSSEHDARVSLTVIYDQIEARTGAVVAADPAWPCRKGCDACCRRLARAPELSAAEWRYLWRGYGELPATVRAEVRARVMALAGHEGHVVCPLLDRAAGACLVYAHRPAACRMYGFYLSRGEGRYCGDIEARVEAGGCEQVVWGNHDAVDDRLRRRFGPPISMLDWFSDMPDR